MLFSLAFLVLLQLSHSLQTTAHEKKTPGKRSHPSPLINHSQTNPHTRTQNRNNNPPSSAKATLHLTSTNRNLSSNATPSDPSSDRTSKKEGSPSPAPHPIKVLISNSWIQKDTNEFTANSTLEQGKELGLERGSPLVLTHQINLVPGACGGCEAEFATLRERLDRLEREVSTLKESCAGVEGAACFLRSDGNECPNDCSDEGRCEEGRCICFPGFNGHDCGTAMCPSDCSNNGQCVHGLCVCDNGYSGLECANKSCPGNCNNQGQCVNGTCICHHGFTGTDCSTAPSGSVRLQSGDITDSSVTLFWTQPAIQYGSYHITFKGQREGDDLITAKVAGRLTSFTQTGLAAGQKYKVSIRGERDGKMGPESTTEFMTAPSGHIHLQSKDRTDSSATLLWTQPSVQYSSYHITFQSQRQGAKTITAKVRGNFTSFTQTGLTAGQKYKVSVRGERDGKMGPESTTELMTAPSGSVHLRRRDITDSSVTLFWTQPSVQYSSYHITFNSQREGDEMITAKVGGGVFTFTQTGLTAGQKYKVSIRGERDGKMGPESSTEFTTAPSGFVHLQSRDITDSSITLFWTQSSVQCSSYHITFKSQRDGGETIQAKVGGRLTSFTQTGLTAGQKYKVSIRGERDGKMGPESTTEFTTAPSGSVHIRSRDVTDSSVALFWIQPSVLYSSYHITFKSQREGDEMITVKVGGKLSSFTQTGLTAGQKYKVSVRGERDGKMGPESTTEFTTVPIGSVRLQTRDITDSSVTLFWTQPSVQYSSYHITFKSQGDGDKMLSAKVGGRITSFTQTGLAAGQKYKVSIRGERDGKMGPESTTDFITVPSGALYLRSRNITDFSITVFWDLPSVPYSSYHITFKGPREGDKIITAKVGGRYTRFTQTGLVAGLKYKVSIRGERDGKMGPESTTEVMTAPSGSVHLQSQDITDSSVTLFWTQPSIQYSSYHITFKIQNVEDKMLTVKAGGRVFSLTQTGLTAGQKYKVSIRGERDGKMGPESTTEFNTAPSGSVHLQSRNVTDSSASLLWTQPSIQYSSYHITFQSQREGDKMITAKVGGSALSLTQTGLTAGQKYKVSIRGERDGKMGPESTTEFSTGPSGSVHLQSRDITDSTVTLFWTQPSVQYSSYHMTFKSQREGDKMITVKVGGRVFTFTQTGLTAGQKYKVSIRGERDGKMGPESSTEFTTAAVGSVHLQSRDITDSTATVFWTQPSVQYSSYHITFKSQKEGDKMIQSKVAGRLTSFTQTGLATGLKYKVSIRGERDGKMGPESTNEFITTPSGSIYLLTRDITDSSVTLFWTQPSVQYSSYYITFKSQRDRDEIIKAKLGGRLTTFTQTGLVAGQKYKVSIRGERDGKMGPESTTEFITAPSGFVHHWSRDITDSSVTLFWSQPSVQYSSYHITFKSQNVEDKMLTVKAGGRVFSLTQTGLTAGQKYKVSVRGERDGKMGPESTTEFTTAPSGSVHLQSRNVTDSSASLLWTQPSIQYSSYHITFQSQREEDKMITAKVGGRVFTLTQTGLTAGQKYKVSIRGERDGKMGPESTTEFTTAPSGSVHLQSRDITVSSATVFWTQPSVQYSNYHITFKSQREGDKTITAKVGGRVFTFTQTGLITGQKYKVSIRGERDGKMGPESSTEFNTAAVGSVHLQSRDITDSTATVFWTQPSVQYSSYHITFKSQKEGDKAIQSKVAGRLTSFTQTGLATGLKYKVSIRGERDGKMGPESTTEFMTTPSGSIYLLTRDITDSSVTLFWTQPSVQYSSYHITFKTQNVEDKMLTVKVGGRVFTFTQTGLATGQKYKVSIRGERDGKMGPESTTEFMTAPSSFIHLRSRDITDSTATLFWTKPSVQYSNYHIIFKSQKEGDEKITAKVAGRLTSFTQTGLAAGLKYKVSIRGERDGKMGPESTTEFTTYISGPKNLHIVETTQTSVLVRWESPMGDIDSYRLSISPSVTKDGKKEGQETTLSPDTDAASIDGLEEGHLYDIILIAQKGRSQSKPIRVQAVPGNGKQTFSKMTVETVTAKLQPVGDIITKKKESDMITLDKSLLLKKNDQVQKQDKEKSSRTGGDSSKTKEGTYMKTNVTASHRIEKTAVTLRTAGAGTEVTAEGGRKLISQSLLKQDVTQGPEERTKVIQPNSSHDSKHHSEVLSNTNLKIPGRKSTKNNEGQRKTHGTMVEKASELLMHSASANNSKSIATKIGVAKNDRIGGRKTSGVEGDVTIPGDSKITGPRKSSISQEYGVETTHGSLGNGTTRYSTWTRLWKSGVKNGTNQTHDLKRRVESSWNVTGTLRTTSTTDSGPVVAMKKGVLKSGGATKASQTISEKEKKNDAKQVSQTGNVTKTHGTATVQLIQPEGRDLGTGGTDMVTFKNGTSIIRQSSVGAVQAGTAPKISSSAPFYWNNSSSSKTTFVHGTTGQNETSGQTGLKAIMRTSTRQKNMNKTAIPQTDVTSVRTRNMESAVNSVEVRNITSRGYIIVWEVPQGMFQSFVLTRREYVLGSGEEGEEKEDTEEEEVSQVIPGNVRSLTFQNLQPHTRYSLTLFGIRSGLRSKIHHVTITTGPESPSELLFSNVTDSSLSVSWKKPKTPITGFKVTYTKTKDGESTSVSVDAKHSSMTLSQLSPGSFYEVSVVSVLGLKESDPVKGLVITVPDPPTGLRAVNVTDTKALLVWKPSLAAVDRYIIIFGSENGPDMTIKVSGSNAAHQLKGLLSRTVYTVTVTSQLDSQQSTGATTTFTTAGESAIRREEIPQEMPVSQVTPRSVVLSWKSPNMAIRSYRLTYQRAGQEAKEITLASTMTKFKLTGLSPLSRYAVQVQGERNGQYITVISTEFKTGSLRFPFPTDCSQELLNGMQQSGEVEVFPAGRQGRPVRVYCDMETDGGGWTVFQRRINGVTHFFRGWNDYNYGFGNLSAEFWLGNENIHNLTSLRPMSLRVDLRAGAESAYAHYSFFYIDGQRKHYALRVSGYSGTAGDSMRYYNGRPFSTHDRDPLPVSTHCATSYRGGWWHKNCHKANINGLYNTGTTHQGVIWTDGKGKDFPILFTEMKLRPASFPSRNHS